MSTNNELSHYGVLGMKWGRHKKVESESVQKARRTLEENIKKAKSEYQRMNRETAYGLLAPSKETLKRVADADREFGYAKQDLKNAKILDLVNSKPKSKSQLAAEEKYKKQGMSDDEATVAAYQSIKTKKILMAIGATALVVGGGYAAYKIHDSRVDKIIKSGTLLQNISADDSKGVRDAFYSSSNALDKAKYKGLYGETLKTTRGAAFKKEIKVLSDIRQASPKNAKGTLEELIKTDPNFANDLKEYLKTNRLGDTYTNKLRTGSTNLSKGIVDRNLYEYFNAALVDHSPEMQSLTNRYFNKLSEKGYNAIKDVNDAKYSGYKSINPILAFNSSGKVNVIDVKELANGEIQKAKNIAYAHIAGTDLVKEGSVIATAMFATNRIGTAVKNRYNNKLIEKYRAENPNTKMTNTEIIRMLERSGA